MTIIRTVKADAADPKQGMTLAELSAFVQEAMRADVPGDTVLRSQVNMRGGIKRLETKA